MFLYPTPVAKGSVPDKVFWTQGVDAQAFPTQLGLYTISNAHIFLNNRSKIPFALLYQTGAERNLTQPINWQLFVGVCIEYTQVPNQPRTETDQIVSLANAQAQLALPLHQVGDTNTDQPVCPRVKEEYLYFPPDVPIMIQ